MLMTNDISHTLGLRLLIRSIEQLRDQPLWPLCEPSVREDIEVLINNYGVSSGGTDAASTGAVAMEEALSFYYRMHNDTSFEVKMLGLMQQAESIYTTMLAGATNLVYGIPHATYLRPPQTLFAASSILWEQERKDSIVHGRRATLHSTTAADPKKVHPGRLPHGMAFGSPLPATPPHAHTRIHTPARTHTHAHTYTTGTRTDTYAQARTHTHAHTRTHARPLPAQDAEQRKLARKAAAEEAEVDEYLLQLFRRSADAISESLHQVLVNDLPRTPGCMRMRNLVFACGSYLVVYAGLFCSAWWRKDLAEMQTLLMHAPNKADFLKLFKVKGDLVLQLREQVMQSIEVQVDEGPASSNLSEWLLSSDGVQDDYVDSEDDHDDGFDSDTSNLSAKLLDEIFKKPVKPLTAADRRELRAKEEYVYGVLRLACVQLVTIRMQTFLSDLGADLDELDTVSPLLYRLMAVFEAWSLQCEMYIKGLDPPENALRLDSYAPPTSQEWKINSMCWAQPAALFGCSPGLFLCIACADLCLAQSHAARSTGMPQYSDAPLIVVHFLWLTYAPLLSPNSNEPLIVLHSLCADLFAPLSKQRCWTTTTTRSRARTRPCAGCGTSSCARSRCAGSCCACSSGRTYVVVFGAVIRIHKDSRSALHLARLQKCMLVGGFVRISHGTRESIVLEAG